MDTTQKNRQAPSGKAPASGAQRSGAKTPRSPESAQQRPRSATQKPRQAPPRQGQSAEKTRKAPPKQSQSAEKARKAPPRQSQSAEKTRKAPPKQSQSAEKTRKAPPRQSQSAEKARKTPPKQRRPARGDEGLDSVTTKKRAYGNSKPKKKSTAAVLAEMLQRNARQSIAKNQARREARANDPKRTRRARQLAAPAVIYTQPKVFSRSRFMVQLLTVTAVVVALVLGVSLFFRVETITVTGAEVYTAWAVREASGISEGDGLLTFSRARAGAQIKANLPYVKEVSFGIKLPDTVNIIIVEDDVVYAIQDQNAQWWLINSSGRVVDQTTNAKSSNYTQVLGVTLTDPVLDEQGVATEAAAATTTETDEAGETVEVVTPVSVTGAQRLKIALEILQALEDNDIVGEAASVNVASTEEIILWYGTRYQVNLGDSANLAYKIACMNDAIVQLSDYQSGILDISFTIWEDKVIYTPFS